MKSTSPPEGVHASPVTTPTSSRSPRTSGKTLGGPRYSGTSSARTTITPRSPSATRRAAFRQMAPHQVVEGDRELLVLGVAGDLDDLEPVQEGRGDAHRDVGGTDEEDPREVEGDVQVVVEEGVVLLGVEHLQEGRRRVSAEVHPQLVQLVQHEDGVSRPRPPDGLDDPPGEGPHVGPPVPADL